MYLGGGALAARLPAPVSAPPPLPASTIAGWAGLGDQHSGSEADSAAGDIALGPLPSPGTAGYASAGEPQESLADDSDLEGLEHPFVGRGSSASEVPETPSPATRSRSEYESGQSEGEGTHAARQLEVAVRGAQGGLPPLPEGGQGGACRDLVENMLLFGQPALCTCSSIVATSFKPAHTPACAWPRRCLPACHVQDRLAELLRRQLECR